MGERNQPHDVASHPNCRGEAPHLTMFFGPYLVVGERIQVCFDIVPKRLCETWLTCIYKYAQEKLSAARRNYVRFLPMLF